MTLKIGIDVGGTFTDFVVASDDAPPRIFKTLSTPADPSTAVVNGLADIAAAMEPPMTVAELAARIDTIVHGTTVTTNATLTSRGAKCGLLTTEGVRDALEMRRGIREEQYNNRATNVKPLVPRALRCGIPGRSCHARVRGENEKAEHRTCRGDIEENPLPRRESVEAVGGEDRDRGQGGEQVLWRDLDVGDDRQGHQEPGPEQPDGLEPPAREQRCEQWGGGEICDEECHCMTAGEVEPELLADGAHERSAGRVGIAGHEQHQQDERTG